MTRYAELDVTTNFSFLRGGSHAEELVATAKALQLAAIAVTDRNTLAGVVRAHLAAREVGGIKFIVGARLDLEDAPSLLAFPRDRAAYGRLCRLLTLGQRRAEKGQCTLFLDDVAAHAEGLIVIALPPDDFSLDPGRTLTSPLAGEVRPILPRVAKIGREGVNRRLRTPSLTPLPRPSPARGRGSKRTLRRISKLSSAASSRRLGKRRGSISRRGTLIAATIAPASKHSRNSHAAKA